MTVIKTIVVVACLWWAAACPAAVRTGLDNVGAHRALFAGRRVGIIANHTARDSNGRFIVDVLNSLEGVRVVALFSPEHGLYGQAGAGQTVDSQVDPTYGLPVHSLYGRTKKPTAAMLADVDVLVFDIQDIGARFYTYVYTMALAMEAAAENGKRFIVLDRPNPINGLTVEGPVLEPDQASFVGMYPIAVRHGMTAAELARMFNGAGWLADGVKADLAVVPMTGWRRSMWYDQTALAFIKPSPNMPDVETASIYPGLCLLEGTNVSEGRGTAKPFRQFGAPWMDAPRLVARLNALKLPGLRFEATSFTPSASKHKDMLCHGVAVITTDRDRLEAFWSGAAIVNEIAHLHPESFKWKAAHFDRLCGTAAVRQAIAERQSLSALKKRGQAAFNTFLNLRQRYLLYTE